MIFPEKPLRVVQTVSGQGTGESIYITEDGRRWKESTPIANSTIPAETRYLHQGHLWSQP